MQFVMSGLFWCLDLAGCIRAGSGVIPTVPHPIETGISALCYPPCVPGGLTSWLDHSSRCCFAKKTVAKWSWERWDVPLEKWTSGTLNAISQSVWSMKPMKINVRIAQNGIFQLTAALQIVLIQPDSKSTPVLLSIFPLLLDNTLCSSFILQNLGFSVGWTLW